MADDEKQKIEPVQTLKLTKPIKAHGEMVDTLNFRAPTGLDIIEVGNPVILDMSSRPPVITHDARKMAQMIARLAAINGAALADMDPSDFSEACWVLTDFFMPASMKA